MVPLPSLIAPEFHFDVRPVDGEGRTTLKDAVEVLAWYEGTRLAMALEGTTLVLKAGGDLAVLAHGRIVLPLAWRRLVGVDSVRRVAMMTSTRDREVRLFPIGEVLKALVGVV